MILRSLSTSLKDLPHLLYNRKMFSFTNSFRVLNQTWERRRKGKIRIKLLIQAVAQAELLRIPSKNYCFLYKANYSYSLLN